MIKKVILLVGFGGPQQILLEYRFACQPMSLVLKSFQRAGHGRGARLESDQVRLGFLYLCFDPSMRRVLIRCFFPDAASLGLGDGSNSLGDLSFHFLNQRIARLISFEKFGPLEFQA